MSFEKIKKFNIGSFVLCLFLFFYTTAYAQERVIRLKDGTLMVGEIVSKDSSAYRIRTKALGEVRAKVEDVQMIEDAASVSSGSEKEVYQQKILSNPSTFAAVEAFSKDQEMVDMLTDPELKDAIMRQDMEYLKKDARFIKFTQHPAIQKIIQDVTADNKGRSN